jgi:hypothetical protein
MRFKHYTARRAAFIFFGASIAVFLGIPSAGGQFGDDSIWVRSLFFLSWVLGTASFCLFLWFRREITSNTLFTLGSGLATGVSLSIFFAPLIFLLFPNDIDSQLVGALVCQFSMFIFSLMFTVLFFIANWRGTVVLQMVE